MIKIEDRLPDHDKIVWVILEDGSPPALAYFNVFMGEDRFQNIWFWSSGDPDHHDFYHNNVIGWYEVAPPE